MKIKIFVLSILFCFSFSCLGMDAVSAQAISEQDAFNQLIGCYKKSLEAEQAGFDRLTFTLAPEELQLVDFTRLAGLNHKFVFKDDKNSYWLFKPGKYEMRAVCMYRVFKLLGLDTPETFWVNAKINGETVGGSIQRFFPAAPTLNHIKPSELNEECLDYLLKTHTIGWLFSSHESEGRHFLAFFGNGRPKKIMRIDNSNSLSLLGKDRLDLSFCPPYYSSCKVSYYYGMWEDFIENKIRLDLKKNIIFIKFMEHIPDEVITELLSPVRPLYTDDIFALLITRKRRLADDFIDFYNKIISQKKDKLLLPNKEETAQGIAEILLDLIKRCGNEVIAQGKKDAGRMSNAAVEKGHNIDINVIASIKGWNVIGGAIADYKARNKNNGVVPPEEYDRMLHELSLLKERSDSAYEKKALDYYIREVRKAAKNKKDIAQIKRIIRLPRFNFSRIN